MFSSSSYFRRSLQSSANIGDGLALFNQLFRGAQLADDLLEGLLRLRFMRLLLAKFGRYGSSHKGWFSFCGSRHEEFVGLGVMNDIPDATTVDFLESVSGKQM